MASEMKLSMVLSVIDKATSPLKGITSAFAAVGEAGKKLTGVGESLRAARENVADFTERLKGGLHELAQPAIEVETSLARLGTVMRPFEGDVSESLGRVRAAALDWQKTHVGSAAAYVAATQKMIGAGLDEAHAISGAAVAMQVANATLSDATAIAHSLGAVYSQLGDKTRPAADELARLGDVMTRAQQVFQMENLGGLPDALKEVAPAATRYRVSIEQLVTGLGALEGAGIKGGEGGKALAEILSALEGASSALGFEIARTADGGVDLVSTLGALERQIGNVRDMTPAAAAAMQQAFGPGASLALQHLLGTSEGLTDALGAIKASAGAAAAAAGVFENTTAGQLAKAEQQLKALKAELAEGFLPAVKELLPHVTDLVQAVSKFAAEHPNLVATAGTIAVMGAAAGSVITPVLSAGGAIASVSGHTLQAVGWLGKADGPASKFAGSLGNVARGAGQFVAASGRMAASLFSQLMPGTAAGIASIGRLTASAVAHGARGAAAFVAGNARMAASLTGNLAASLATSAAGFARLTGQAILYATRGVDRMIVGAVKMGASLLASVVPGLAAATAGAFSFAAALLANPITWIVAAVIAAVALIYIYWEPISEFFAGLWNDIKAAFLSAGDAVSAAWGQVVGFFTGIWGEIKGAFNEGFVNGIVKVIETFSPLAWIAKGLNAVSEWLFGFSLFDAGSNIVNTIVEGITSMASKPVEAMKSIVGKVRNLLPFSPAKEGPLRDLHRVKLVETVAEAVRPAPLVNAMRGVAGDAMAVLTRAQVPPLAPMPSPSALAAVRAAPTSAGGTGPVTMHVTFNFAGGGSRSAVEELEAWIRDPANARRLASAVQNHQAREARAAFT